MDTDKPEDMVAIKVSDVPGNIPQLDPVAGKTITKPNLKSLPKVKCPKCGRGVIIKKLPETYTKTFAEIDEKNRKEAELLDRKKRVEDGRPLKREQDPDFLA